MKYILERCLVYQNFSNVQGIEITLALLRDLYAFVKFDQFYSYNILECFFPKINVLFGIKVIAKMLLI